MALSPPPGHTQASLSACLLRVGCPTRVCTARFCRRFVKGLLFVGRRVLQARCAGVYTGSPFSCASEKGSRLGSGLWHYTFQLTNPRRVRPLNSCLALQVLLKVYLTGPEDRLYLTEQCVSLIVHFQVFGH